MSTIANSAPFYGVDIDLHNVGVDIRVNDVPTYYDYTKGQLTVEMPAPGSIVDGLNKLSIKTFLPNQTTEFEEGAFVTATLFKQDLSSGDNKTNLVSTTIKINNKEVITHIINHQTNEKSNSTFAIAEDRETYVEATTILKSPFPRWKWQDGQEITNNDENFDSLLDMYRKIHATLKAKDLVGLKELYSLRAREIAISFGLPNEEEGQKKLSTGNDMLNDNLELFDLHTKGIKLEIVGDGKLAFIRTDLNAQPIFYLQKKPRLLHLYKFMFYRNDKNEWVMIR